MKTQKIGMRTIKTVIAVVLTLEISKLLNINSPILAGIAAIMTMETSVSESFSAGKFRMYGTVLGALVALVITLIMPVNFITTAIGLIVIIHLSNMLNWQDAVKMAMIVFLVIIIDFKEGYRFMYALNRTIDTFIGVIVGTAINYFIRPPKIDRKIYSIIENTTNEIVDAINVLVWKEEDVELNDLKKEIDFIEENYEKLKEDLKFKKSTDSISRNYGYIFELFQNIHSHLRILKLIDEKIPVDEKIPIDSDNRKLLVKRFAKKIPKIEDVENKELYIIYNYHLRRILYDLEKVEDIYYDRDLIKQL